MAQQLRQQEQQEQHRAGQPRCERGRVVRFRLPVCSAGVQGKALLLITIFCTLAGQLHAFFPALPQASGLDEETQRQKEESQQRRHIDTLIKKLTGTPLVSGSARV